MSNILKPVYKDLLLIKGWDLVELAVATPTRRRVYWPFITACHI